MELSYYLRIIGRRWPVAVIGLLLTTALTLAFLQQQPLEYRSTGTMVVRPRTVDSGDSVRAIETLTRGVEITSTYATIARSDAIRQRARQRLDPSLDTSGTRISSEVVTSTNILEISVTGGDPETVATYASEITRQTVAYVGELQNVYELQVIDEPQVPIRPVAPNRPLILATGVALGLGVGVVFALLAEAAAVPARARRMRRRVSTRIRSSDVIDSRPPRSHDGPTEQARNSSSLDDLDLSGLVTDARGPTGAGSQARRERRSGT